MSSRGIVLPTCRTTALIASAVLSVAALAGCSDDEPTAAPKPATSESTSASAPTSSGPTETATATPSVASSDATTAPAPAQSASGTGGSGSTSGSSGGSGGSSGCAASQVAAPNTSGMSAKAAAKAKQVHSAAKACDAEKLISLARADATGFAGEKAANAIFTSNAPQTYVALATVLTLPPTETFDGTIQPRVFSEQFAENEAEWDKVIAARLVTRDGAAKMRLNDGGYTGYRVGFAGDGTWTFFTTGR
ncbi:hypothetical protein N802_04745 [Knoellia sinensis KCTC 19936]|uniref:Uncharacterized protein n=1 Tax=Knoellia sinensis KCTC 19936 TaxID=1385520 RepID=A0A0A0J261_9MICO|nr:hypothetical protein [Knoellia sinensis]KGN31198.1 hypothetical protein N802_04745 [Knoellia sinensis KCTC 19936]